MLYRIHFQMEIDDWSEKVLFATMQRYIKPKSCDDLYKESSTCFCAIFRSDLLPSEMSIGLAKVMKDMIPHMLYADVLYRYPEEMFHDRFVVWNDGTMQDYRTSSVYEECGDRVKVV